MHILHNTRRKNCEHDLQIADTTADSFLTIILQHYPRYFSISDFQCSISCVGYVHETDFGKRTRLVHRKIVVDCALATCSCVQLAIPKNGALPISSGNRYA